MLQIWNRNARKRACPRVALPGEYCETLHTKQIFGDDTPSAMRLLTRRSSSRTAFPPDPLGKRVCGEEGGRR